MAMPLGGDLLCMKALRPWMWSLLCGAFLFWLQRDLTRRSDPNKIVRVACKADVRHQADLRSQDPEDAAKESRVQQEIERMQVSAFRMASSALMYMQLCVLMVTMVDYQLRSDFPRLIWMLCCLMLYFLYFLTSIGFLEISGRVVRILCLLLHSLVLGLVCLGAWDSKEDFMDRKSLLATGHVILALMFPLRRVVAAFAVCFLVAFTVSSASACGPDSINAWFTVTQALHFGLVVSIPITVENIVWDRIKASLQYEDADSLVLAFRQMLRGVCDGDILLDSNFKICGDAGCLQRLLRTQDPFSGVRFPQLIARDPGAFEQFMREGTARQSRGAPQCLRVALKSPGPDLPVDVFHVALPGLYGVDTMHHLLAVTEDSDSRIQPEASQDAVPSDLLTSRGRGPRTAGTRSQVSSPSQARSEVVEFYDELEELSLLLNPSTESFDIEEASFHFARRGGGGGLQLGMPSLRRFLRPLDWHEVEGKLRQYAHDIMRRRRPRHRSLAPLMLRLPGESRTFLRARSATLENVYGGFLPEGEPPYMYLRLSKFNESRRRRRQAVPTPLEGVEEDDTFHDHAK